METPKSNKSGIEDLLGDEAKGHTAADKPAESKPKTKVEVPVDDSKVHDIERTPAHWHIEPHAEDDDLIIASNGATGKVFIGTRKAFSEKYYKRY